MGFIGFKNWLNENKFQSDAMGYNIGKYIYHTTPIKNLDKIKYKGLKLRSGITISGENFKNRIYFSTSLIAAYDILVNFGSYRDNKAYAIFKLNSNCLINGYKKDPLFVHGIFVNYNIDRKYILEIINADDLFNKFNEEDIENLYI